MSTFVAILLAVLAGICAGIQPGINAGVGKIIGSLEGALVSFGVGFFILLGIVTFFGSGDFSKITVVPKPYFLAGVLGAIVVTSLIFTVSAIGSAASLTILVAVQLIVAMVVDHFGWFGAVRIPIDFYRIGGLVLMLLGIKMIMK